MSEADLLARRVAEAMLSREGTGPAWGIVIEGAREGYSKLSMKLRADMLNGHGAAHGGVIFALADTAFAYACNSRNEITVAQSATITFLSAAREGETLVAESREPARQGRSGTYHVSVRSDDGRAVAELMTRSVITCGPFDVDSTVLAIMTEHRMRHVPVVVDGDLYGLVSIGDVVKAQHDELVMENHLMHDYIQGGGSSVVAPL